MYVFSGWTDDIGNRLSYANPSLKTIHVNVDDDCGHELSHILSSNVLCIRSRFIDEGIAEYFDEMIRGYEINALFKKPEWKDIYRDFTICESDLAYLLARVLVSSILKYYKGDFEMARPLLEVESFEESYSFCCDFDCIIKNADNLFSMLLKSNLHDNKVYIGKNDLFETTFYRDIV